jgi:hypothetical protein
MASERLPESLRARSDREAILEDLEPYRGTTMAERVAVMESLCRAAAEAVAAHPDGQRILDWQDARTPESEALWLELVRRAAPDR